jgi:hypothetical protein
MVSVYAVVYNGVSPSAVTLKKDEAYAFVTFDIASTTAVRAQEQSPTDGSGLLSRGPPLRNRLSPPSLSSLPALQGHFQEHTLKRPVCMMVRSESFTAGEINSGVKLDLAGIGGCGNGNGNGDGVGQGNGIGNNGRVGDCNDGFNPESTVPGIDVTEAALPVTTFPVTIVPSAGSGGCGNGNGNGDGAGQGNGIGNNGRDGKCNDGASAVTTVSGTAAAGSDSVSTDTQSAEGTGDSRNGDGTKKNSESSISAGGIVGISIGAIAGVILVVIIGLCCVKRNRKAISHDEGIRHL